MDKNGGYLKVAYTVPNVRKIKVKSPIEKVLFYHSLEVSYFETLTGPPCIAGFSLCTKKVRVCICIRRHDVINTLEIKSLSIGPT